MRSFLSFIIAMAFFALGIVGLLLPVVPQVPFFVLGLLFLASSSLRFRKFLTGTKVYGRYLKEPAENSRVLSRYLKLNEE